MGAYTSASLPLAPGVPYALSSPMSTQIVVAFKSPFNGGANVTAFIIYSNASSVPVNVSLFLNPSLNTNLKQGCTAANIYNAQCTFYFNNLVPPASMPAPASFNCSHPIP